MTCASCANRIERKLNKLDGVTATVNYATEKAKVTFPDGVDPHDLIAEVEKAGYTAALPRRRAGRAGGQPEPDDELRAAAAAADHRGGPVRAGDRDGDGPGAAVRRTGSGCR